MWHGANTASSFDIIMASKFTSRFVESRCNEKDWPLFSRSFWSEAVAVVSYILGNYCRCNSQLLNIHRTLLSRSVFSFSVGKSRLRSSRHSSLPSHGSDVFDSFQFQLSAADHSHSDSNYKWHWINLSLHWSYTMVSSTTTEIVDDCE